MAEDMITPEDLRELTRKLLSLLDDPQPGDVHLVGVFE